MLRMAEMHVFHQQIGGKQEIFPRAPRPEDGAIVADAHYQAASQGQAHPAADGFQDGSFAGG
jgi:hypothetical protein